MGWIWIREWNRWKKDMLLQLVTGLPLLLLIFLIYKGKSSLLVTVGTYVLQLPKEVYAWLGFVPEIQADAFCLYLFFPVLCMNLWLAWKGCTRTIRIVHMDEQNGSVFGMCNQMYSRTQLGTMKLLWAEISFLGSYVIFGLCLFLFIILGSSTQTQRSQGMEMGVKWLVLGILLNGMWIAITFLYTVYKDKKSTMRLYGWVDMVLFGTLALGNLYKIRNLIYLLFDKLELKNTWIPTMKEALDWMDGLYWLSPLSWLNPYNLQQGQRFVIQCGIGVLLWVGMALLGIIGYRRRNLYAYQ